MNQHKRILKAVSLLQPVLAAVSVRRPAGMTGAQADSVCHHLVRSVDGCLKALELYERAADKKAGVA